MQIHRLIWPTDRVDHIATHGVKLAPASSQVAKNLRYVLRCLADCGRRVEEVLLFFSPEHPDPIPPTLEPSSIRLVLFPFPASDNVAFVRMTA